MDHTAKPLGRQAGAVSVWHPESLDVDALLESYGQRAGEGVLWLGHCIYVSLADDARCRDTGRVPLKTEYLRSIIGRHHVDAVRQAALEVGYVDRDRSYRAGDRSQAYWILPPYDRARLVQREIASSGLRRNIGKWRAARRRETWHRIERNETLVDAAVCKHLWRNLQKVEIDAVIDFGEAFHPAHQISVEHIRQGDLWFTVDDFGRVHTNVTNLSRALRPYLAVQGERLANVDISESQPLFFGMALASAKHRNTQSFCPTYGGRPFPFDRSDRSTDRPFRPLDGKGRQTTRRQETERPPADHHHMLDNTMMDNTMMDKDTLLGGGFDRKGLPPDMRRYIELCEARGLYQLVADRLGKTREEAKHGVMVVFFDKPWHRNKVSEVLEGLFPTVMQDIRDIKRQDYRRLAHFAQRIESAFMFGHVIPRIMTLRPELFTATIHDSVLTPLGDAPFVRQVMLEQFAQLGVSPQVKIEPCSIAPCAGLQMAIKTPTEENVGAALDGIVDIV